MSNFQSIEDVTEEFGSNLDLDNVIKSKITELNLSKMTLVDAVKPATIEYDPDKSTNSVVESSNKLIDSSDPNEKVDETEEPIKDTLVKLLDIYKDKYGYQISYDGFEDALGSAIASSKSAREISSAIQSDLAATMSEVLIFKSIIVIGRVIDSQLNGIMSQDFTNALNGETVSVLNQMFGWVERLEAIKAKYTQFDISQKIKDINSSKRDVAKRSDLEKHLIDILRYGIDSGLTK